MIKFLLDANLSPRTAEFLRGLGWNVKSLLEENLGQISDEKVIRLAKKERRIVVTMTSILARFITSEKRERWVFLF